MTEAELITLIRSTFPSEPLPTIVVTASDGTDEAILARKMLSGHNWHSLSFADMAPHWEGANVADALTFLTPEAFRYYLPAFMLLALEEGKQKTVESINSLINNLGGLMNGPIPDYKLSVLQGFSVAQKQTIAIFIKCTKELYKGLLIGDPLGELLTKYWGQYLPPGVKGEPAT